MSFGKDHSSSHPTLTPLSKNGRDGGGKGASDFGFRPSSDARSNNSNQIEGEPLAVTKPGSSDSKRSTENNRFRLLSSGRKTPAADAAVVSTEYKRHKKSNVAETSPTPAESRAASDSTVETVESKIVKRKKRETWLMRRGHPLTFWCLVLFTATLYFRPYELHPALAGFSQLALVFALLTIFIYVPSQLSAEERLTASPPEIVYLLLLTAIGLLTIPIARSPGMAWEGFFDPFFKIVLIFIVMVNVVRTEFRLRTMILLAIGAGLMLSYTTLLKYINGDFDVEGYRVDASVNGMFGNPNDAALHFVIIAPLALLLGFASTSKFKRAAYYALTAIFIAANMITFSRGGFLGLMFAAGVLIWKLGRGKRLKITAVSLVLTVIFVALAPGGYGTRILSIFAPEHDKFGSGVARREHLVHSIVVTLRNPWGIGMNNFRIVASNNQVSHNAYTQVSSELGIPGLICFLAFLVVPLRRLKRVEDELFEAGDHRRLYYYAVGLQASMVGAMVSIFFLSVAYQWFMYYLVGYAITTRRVYEEVRERERREAAKEKVRALRLKPVE